MNSLPSRPARTGLLASVLATATFLLAGSAQAQAVSFHFSGTIGSVTDPGGLLPADIVVGTPFSGTLSYDAAGTTDFQSGNSTVGQYRFEGALAENFSMNVTLGSHTLEHVAEPALPNTIEVVFSSFHQLFYQARFPLLDGAAAPGAAGDIDMFVSLENNSGGILSSDALPTFVPSLADFESTGFAFRAYNGTDTYQIFGEITTLTPVPEPASASLLWAGLGGFWLLRRRRQPSPLRGGIFP